jgi:hypothetical protein
MTPEEVLLRIAIPYTRPNEFVKEFKQSPRRDDDIAIVNAGESSSPAHKPMGQHQYPHPHHHHHICTLLLHPAHAWCEWFIIFMPETVPFAVRCAPRCAAQAFVCCSSNLAVSGPSLRWQSHMAAWHHAALWQRRWVGVHAVSCNTFNSSL